MALSPARTCKLVTGQASCCVVGRCLGQPTIRSAERPVLRRRYNRKPTAPKMMTATAPACGSTQVSSLLPAPRSDSLQPALSSMRKPNVQPKEEHEVWHAKAWSQTCVIHCSRAFDENVCFCHLRQRQPQLRRRTFSWAVVMATGRGLEMPTALRRFERL